MRKIILSIVALCSLSGCSGLTGLRNPIEMPTQNTQSPAVLSNTSSTAVPIAPIDAILKLSATNLANQLSDIDPATLPDLWARIRIGFTMPDLDTPDVERFAQRFARTGLLDHLAPRARRYLYLVVSNAEKRNLPTELALLPIIESGLNPLAHSPADAVGLCQFIPATGKRFGLSQSALGDRRKDLACVNSMFDYLERNAALFGGDWHLALAAYNWGEGSITKAIERNSRLGLSTDYLSLQMPNETRAYVPQLLAIRRLIADPARYGVRLPDIENKQTITCDVAVSRDIDVDKAARLANISLSEFRSLNPGIRMGIIPHTTHSTICLPLDAATQFQVNVSEHKGPLASWTTHTVDSRTTLAKLAKKIGASAEVIRSANSIPVGMRLKAGATLLVPRVKADGDIPLSVAMSAITLVEPDIPDSRKVTIKVKHKDSFVTIAKRHKIKSELLKTWNPDVREPLVVGQKLVLHLSLKQKSTIPKGTKKAEALSPIGRVSLFSDRTLDDRSAHT